MNGFLPITLGVSRPIPLKAAADTKGKKSGAGSTGSVSPSDKKISPELKTRILERDSYGCRYCGFTARKYQEINFLNGNKRDLNEKNLVTACIFCQQCFLLDEVNVMRSGVLLWLPEIEQAQLSHMARAIYVARISQGPAADAARKSLDVLMARREEAKKRISTDNPYILATVLQDYLGGGHYEMRDKKLKGIRLFPLDRRIIKEADLEFNQFPQILAYWRSKDGPFGNKPPAQWLAIYKGLMDKAA
ncbi:MAG: type IV secretion protein DotN [Alphaproteobacteria bacterium]